MNESQGFHRIPVVSRSGLRRVLQTPDCEEHKAAADVSKPAPDSRVHLNATSEASERTRLASAAFAVSCRGQMEGSPGKPGDKERQRLSRYR